MRRKYVVFHYPKTPNSEFCVLIAEHVAHDTTMEMIRVGDLLGNVKVGCTGWAEPLSAGFFTIGATDAGLHVECFGHSETLVIASRGEADATIIRNFLMGALT